MYKIPELSTYEWQKAVQSILSTPPLSPSKGNRYIVGPSPTGVWEGKTNQIAEYDSSWDFVIPSTGMMAYVIAYDRLLQYTTFWDELRSVGKEVVTPQNTGIVLSNSQFGETIQCNSDVDQTFILPSVDVTDVGYWYRFLKLGTGKLTIQAADSDTIADSGAGGTIYNNDIGQLWSTLTLMLGSETKWVIIEGHGSWTTTE